MNEVLEKKNVLIQCSAYVDVCSLVKSMGTCREKRLSSVMN